MILCSLAWTIVIDGRKHERFVPVCCSRLTKHFRTSWSWRNLLQGMCRHCGWTRVIHDSDRSILPHYLEQCVDEIWKWCNDCIRLYDTAVCTAASSVRQVNSAKHQQKYNCTGNIMVGIQNGKFCHHIFMSTHWFTSLNQEGLLK